MSVDLPPSVYDLQPDIPALVRQCAPDVGPTTLQAILRTESGGHPYAIADAGPRHVPWRIRRGMVRSLYPATLDEAERVVQELHARGHLVAIGLMQVHIRHLEPMGLTIRQAFDPCTNIAAGASILKGFYHAARRSRHPDDPHAALLAALSAYWSGSFTRGITGGYVQKVLDQARIVVSMRSIRHADARASSAPLASP